MIRPLINAVLGLGYVLGVILVWIGIEMYVIDGSRFAPALFSVLLGIVIWGMLTSLGRHVRPYLRAAPGDRP